MTTYGNNLFNSYASFELDQSKWQVQNCNNSDVYKKQINDEFNVYNQNDGTIDNCRLQKMFGNLLDYSSTSTSNHTTPYNER